LHFDAPGGGVVSSTDTAIHPEMGIVLMDDRDLTHFNMRGADTKVRLGRAKWKRVKDTMVPGSALLAGLSMQDALAAVMAWVNENYRRADGQPWTPELWATDPTVNGKRVRRATWEYFKPARRRTLDEINPERAQLRRDLEARGLGLKDYDHRRSSGWSHEDAVSIPVGQRRPKRPTADESPQ